MTTTNYREGNYWQGNADHPYHLSVGAVLINDEKKVCALHYTDFHDPTDGTVYPHLYTLMRKTLEPNETLEQALLRGIALEFGAIGKIVEFLGSQRGPFFHKGVQVEKTTVYFLVRYESAVTAGETGAAVEWMEPGELMEKMRHQHMQTPDRGDIDEAEIIERARKYMEA